MFGGFTGFDDTFRDRIEYFIMQVAGGAEPGDIDGSGEAGLEASRVIHAAIKSLETGMVINIADI